jgi:hypothetical protein
MHRCSPVHLFHILALITTIFQAVFDLLDISLKCNELLYIADHLLVNDFGRRRLYDNSMPHSAFPRIDYH